MVGTATVISEEVLVVLLEIQLLQTGLRSQSHPWELMPMSLNLGPYSEVANFLTYLSFFNAIWEGDWSSAIR